MKIQPYVEKLNGSKEFEEFKKKYKDAFLVAGFFVLDFESGQNIHQIDYYIPSEGKVAAFTLDGKVVLQILDMLNDKIPERLDIQTKIDLDALKGILEDEMKNRNITEDLKKIVAVIQTIEGKKLWVLNCILSGMEILKAHIDDDNKIVLKMEKSSILDYVKKIPMVSPEQKPLTQRDLDKQIEQLEKLKEVLKEEKVGLSESSPKNQEKK